MPALTFLLMAHNLLFLNLADIIRVNLFSLAPQALKHFAQIFELSK